MIFVRASSTAKTTAQHSASGNPKVCVSSPVVFRTTQRLSGLLRNSILRSRLPPLMRTHFPLAENPHAPYRQINYLSRSFAYLAGTARFEPPKPFSTAKFIPITFPLRLKSGPPEPPDVVA